MSDTEKRIGIIKTLGFRKFEDRPYSVEFRTAGGEYFYLQKTKKISIVLDPRKVHAGSALAGVVGQDRFNSNFNEFPKKFKNGKAPEKYGTAFDAKDDSHMKKIITEALGV